MCIVLCVLQPLGLLITYRPLLILKIPQHANNILHFKLMFYYIYIYISYIFNVIYKQKTYMIESLFCSWHYSRLIYLYHIEKTGYYLFSMVDTIHPKTKRSLYLDNFALLLISFPIPKHNTYYKYILSSDGKYVISKKKEYLQLKCEIKK